MYAPINAAKNRISVDRNSHMNSLPFDNGKAVASQVALGERSNGEVEVVSGLSAGTTIVVGGQQRLRDGVAVEIVAPAGQSDNEVPAAAQPVAKRS